MKDNVEFSDSPPLSDISHSYDGCLNWKQVGPALYSMMYENTMGILSVRDSGIVVRSAVRLFDVSKI